jgi:hypothetical protein
MRRTRRAPRATKKQRLTLATLQPVPRLLLRIARAADRLARRLRRKARTINDDAVIWARAEKHVLGESAVRAGISTAVPSRAKH